MDAPIEKLTTTDLGMILGIHALGCLLLTVVLCRFVPLLPGVGLVELTPGDEPRTRVSGSGFERTAIISGDGELLVFGRPNKDEGTANYAWIDRATGRIDELWSDARPTVLLGVSTTMDLFTRGDANLSGSVDIADPLTLLFHLFLGSFLACEERTDADDNGVLELSDAIVSLQAQFLGGMTFPSP